MEQANFEVEPTSSGRRWFVTMGGAQITEATTRKYAEMDLARLKKLYAAGIKLSAIKNCAGVPE